MSDDYDDGAWDAEPMPRAFCDVYAIHEAHTYRAVNGNYYDCGGFDAEDDAHLTALQNEPPCEHGLSAHLCAGPMHYPPDREEW